MNRVGHYLLRARGTFSVQLEKTVLLRKPSDALKCESVVLPSFCMLRRGVKTSDTVHPKPIYDEDEKILDKVLEERHKDCDDLPIGMANPYEKPKQKCILCEHGITVNWKNVKLLYQFMSPYTGMLYERHVTGLCKKQYDLVEQQIKIALSAGIMSNYTKGVEFLKDPVLCDPERPIKPHKWC